MKTLLLITTLIISNTAFANFTDNTIEDLKSILLRVNESEVVTNIHYPNYRMGGGTGPNRQLIDCLLLDIKDSDHRPTLEQKLQIAEQIKVLEGFGIDNSEYTELIPEVKGQNVVFKLVPINFYVQTLKAVVRTGESLKEAIDPLMPPTRRGNSLSQVNLLYVRDCRL